MARTSKTPRRTPSANARAINNRAVQSLRDTFALAALNGMIASPPVVDRFSVDKAKWARIAYEWADAMLSAR